MSRPSSDACPPSREAHRRLKSDTRVLASAVVCTLAGDLDPDTFPVAASALGEALDQASPLRRLLVDLSGIGFFSSAGLQLLLGARQAADERKVAMALVAPSERTRRVLDITGTDQVFLIHASLTAALLRGNS